MSFWETVKSLNCLCGGESVSIGEMKFVVRERLGEGGFATIDLVEDKHTRKFYALKRITCHSIDDEREALKEATYMREFKHPNLVPSEGHGVVPSRSQSAQANFDNHSSGLANDVVIVMPYYKRGSVAEELERLKMSSRCMNEDRILDLLYGICSGLHHLHNHQPINIAHRDVKPHNVMFHTSESFQEIPILVDFGSMGPARCVITNSSEARRLQDFAAEKCSMPYRAPELFQVESDAIIDEKVDVWSLGCTLYAMCFHESPFDGVYQRGDSVALAVMAGKIKIPEHHRFSQSLLGVVMMMLKVDPKDRPSVGLVMQEVARIKPDVRML